MLYKCSLLFLFSLNLFALDIINAPILTPTRLELTKQYAKRHYGLDTYHLHQPQVIVVHYTGIGTLQYSLLAFVNDRIPSSRRKIAPFGQVNVGCHYVVAADGRVFSLLPTTIMARHAVGYNYTSIAIENVGAEWTSLNDIQLERNVTLVMMLLQRHPSIKYLIGHHEYMMRRLPHYALKLTKDEDYDAPIKIDPGFKFMNDLRQRLYEQHQVRLLH
eukprot:COSAG01_NODE_1461_length_10242_cov_4.896283_5_plen_217_part_00